MATFTKMRPRPGYTISGNSPEVKYAAESAGRTHKAGAFLIFSASMRLIPIPTTTGWSQADKLVGIAGQAVKDGGNYTNSTTQVPYYVANDDTVFVGNGVSRASAAASTLKLQNIGTVACGSFTNSGLYVALTGKAATNSILIIRGFADGATVGDTNGLVYFTFLKGARNFAR